MAAGIDLLVVDEAQRLRRPPGHPGEPGYRAVAPIAALGRHVLLLSATPLEDDAHGFFRLLQLLRPDEFPEAAGRRGAARRPACRCRRAPARRAGWTSAGCRRACRCRSICRPRRVHALGVGLASGAEPRRRDDPVAARRAVDRIRRALASGAALKAVLGPDETELRQQADAMDRTDPRLAWLLAQATRWRRANEKTLVFVAHRETLEMLRDALSARAQLASGVFHEELSAARRDTEVARFRAADGPSLLVSTEAGGEGRNFEFCHRLVLYDLPWKPSTVEQRIGRLDRIGRRIPVEIVYFRPASGIGADVVRLFERLGLFREPIAGVEPQLAHVERALEEIALDPDAALSEAQIERLVAAAQAARTRIHEAAYQQLHRDPYRAELGPSILARVPAGLDALMEQVVVTAASRLGFRVEQVRGRRAYAIEFGNEALVDSLPGVPGGVVLRRLVRSRVRGRGRDDRLLRLGPPAGRRPAGALRGGSEGPRRAARGAHPRAAAAPGWSPSTRTVPSSRSSRSTRTGSARPDWAEAFRRRPLAARRMQAEDAAAHDWPALVARLAPQLGSRRPHAIAAVIVSGVVN